MADRPIRLTFEGRELPANEGDSVATALLRAGVGPFSRGPKYHRPRGPYCFAGTCAQCHMRIDGEPNVPTCETPVRDGMVVERQNVLGTGDTDLLRAVDFIFRDKLDHHHLMTRFRGLSAATQAIARRLAGIGERPERILAEVPAETVEADCVVVGGGAEGLAAAAKQEGRVLLLDSRPALGGRALDGIAERPESRLPANVEVRLDTRVIGLFEEGGGRYVLARSGDALLRVAVQRVVLATGGIERTVPFEANDLPGVYAGRGLLRAVRRTGILAGAKTVVIGLDADAPAVAHALAEAGLEVVALVDPEARFAGETGLNVLAGASPVRATGTSKVGGLRIRQADGTEKRLACEAVAVVAPLAPSYELGAEVGAKAHFRAESGGFVLQTDASGRTSVPWVSAVGRLAFSG